jgi:hypothetical protein
VFDGNFNHYIFRKLAFFRCVISHVVYYIPFNVRLKAHSTEDGGLIFRLQLSATLATCRGPPPPPPPSPTEAVVASVAMYMKQNRRAPTDFRLVGDAIK